MELHIAPGNTGSRTRVERSNFRPQRLLRRTDHFVRDAIAGYYWPHFIQLLRWCQKTSAIVARAVSDASTPIKLLTAYAAAFANPIPSEYPRSSLTPQGFRNASLREARSVSTRPASLSRRRSQRMPVDTKVIVRRLYEDVWNKRKLEVVSDLFSPSHALHDSNFSGSSVGPEAYKTQ